MTTTANEGLVLRGLDGANPLAFLAALGALRGLTIAWPDRKVELSWVPMDVWRPSLHVDGEGPEADEVLDGLEHFIDMRLGHQALSIDDNLQIKADTFREHARRAADEVSVSPLLADRAEADFIAAFGCDAVRDTRQDVIQDTALRTLSGAGHQHFLRTMRQLVEKGSRELLIRCLFQEWARQDSRLSLRWDPEDDRRYALQWRDPSKLEPRTVWGANRLAFEALPLLPTVPRGEASLATTGFSRVERDLLWTWPIWEKPIAVDVVRSLLAHSQLQQRQPDRKRLHAMGVSEVFRSQRITTGQYRNFTPSRPV